MPCFKCIGLSHWKLVSIITVGWTRYVQYVRRLNGKNPLYDNKLLIGFANPQEHDNVIHISAIPHANLNNKKNLIYGTISSNNKVWCCCYHFIISSFLLSSIQRGIKYYNLCIKKIQNRVFERDTHMRRRRRRLRGLRHENVRKECEWKTCHDYQYVQGRHKKTWQFHSAVYLQRQNITMTNVKSETNQRPMLTLNGIFGGSLTR